MKRLKKTGATDEHRLDLSCFIRVYLCLSVASLFVFFSQPTGGGFVSGHGFSRADGSQERCGLQPLRPHESSI
ncbi:MAG: hypothetical protein ABSH42_04345 [Bryobacteraceae bacterium]